MNTNVWKLDLFSALDRAHCLQTVMDASVAAVRPFGLDFCTWRLASFAPIGGQRISITSTNDKAHLIEIARGYDDSPCSRHCARSLTPFQWLGTTQDYAFKQAPILFEEYYSFGHYAGWAKSINHNHQHYDMFYVESTQPLSTADMHHIDQHMKWVCAATYVRINELPSSTQVVLTDEQRQILCLYAQGYHRIDDISDVIHRPLIWTQAVLQKALQVLGCSDINMAVARAIFLKLIY